MQTAPEKHINLQTEDLELCRMRLPVCVMTVLLCKRYHKKKPRPIISAAVYQTLYTIFPML